MSTIDEIWFSDGDWFALFRNESFEISDCIRAWSDFPSEENILSLCEWDSKFSNLPRPNKKEESYDIRFQWRIHRFARTAKSKSAYQRWCDLENNDGAEWLHSPDYYHDFLSDLREDIAEDKEPLRIVSIDDLGGS